MEHQKKWYQFWKAIDLQTSQIKSIAQELHKGSYKALELANQTGDITPVKATCGNSLTAHYTRDMKRRRALREAIKWEGKYDSFMPIRILSHKFGQSPIVFQDLPIGQQQFVARIYCEQSLTQGKRLGKAKNGEEDIEWGTKKTVRTVETMIAQRKLIAGKWEPWKIFSFKSPEGTREELESFRDRTIGLKSSSDAGSGGGLRGMLGL